MRKHIVLILGLCAALDLAAQAVPSGQPLIEYITGNKRVPLRSGDSITIGGIPFEIRGPDAPLLDRSADGLYYTQPYVKDDVWRARLVNKGNVVLDDLPYSHAFCGSRRLICFSENEIFSIGLPSLKKEWSRKLEDDYVTVDIDEKRGLMAVCMVDLGIVHLIGEDGRNVRELRPREAAIYAAFDSDGNILTLEGAFDSTQYLCLYDGPTGRIKFMEYAGYRRCIRSSDTMIDRGSRRRILMDGYCTNQEMLRFDIATRNLASRKKEEAYGPSLGYWNDTIVTTNAYVLEIEIMDNDLRVLETAHFRDLPWGDDAEPLSFESMTWTPQGLVLWLIPSRLALR